MTRKIQRKQAKCIKTKIFIKKNPHHYLFLLLLFFYEFLIFFEAQKNGI